MGLFIIWEIFDTLELIGFNCVFGFNKQRLVLASSVTGKKELFRSLLEPTNLTRFHILEKSIRFAIFTDKQPFSIARFFNRG